MPNALKHGLLPPPDKMKRLPIDARGYPVPWFVAWINGEPDFRVIKPQATEIAHDKGLCWLCGGRMGSGPMCTINRVSPEPPSHLSCAEYAVVACPFLTQPKMVRSPREMPTEAKVPPGVMIERNPGVTCIWTTRQYSLIEANGGMLFSMGPPDNVEWFSRGRHATWDEVNDAIASGMPILQKMAEEEGKDAEAELLKRHSHVISHYLPEE